MSTAANTPAGGDGGRTRGSIIAAAVGGVCLIIAMIALIVIIKCCHSYWNCGSGRLNDNYNG